MNVLLEDTEEKITYIEKDPATGQDVIKIKKREFPLIFVRGDMIILVSPLLRPV